MENLLERGCSIGDNVGYMASWGLKCATLSSHDNVN